MEEPGNEANNSQLGLKHSLLVSSHNDSHKLLVGILYCIHVANVEALSSPAVVCMTSKLNVCEPGESWCPFLPLLLQWNLCIAATLGAQRLAA